MRNRENIKPARRDCFFEGGWQPQLLVLDHFTGAPDEVPNAALDSAINGTSSNTNDVSTLDTEPSDPPTFADYEALRAKMNEFIVAARR